MVAVTSLSPFRRQVVATSAVVSEEIIYSHISFFFSFLRSWQAKKGIYNRTMYRVSAPTARIPSSGKTYSDPCFFCSHFRKFQYTVSLNMLLTLEECRWKTVASIAHLKCLQYMSSKILPPSPAQSPRKPPVGATIWAFSSPYVSYHRHLIFHRSKN